MQITLSSLQETDNFAKCLSPHLAIGDVVELKGDLGAGKTALARCIINNLSGSDADVTSPTFNIVQLYDTLDFTIWHFDLYRLKSPHELVEIGLDEALSGGVSLIEWPEIAVEYLPQARLIINLSCGKDEQRVLSLDGYGKWEKIIHGLVISD